MTVKGGPYATIDEATADKIKELHKNQPQLGRWGLEKALEGMEIAVDAKELEHFMQANRIKADKTYKPRRLKDAPPYLIANIPPYDVGDGGSS